MYDDFERKVAFAKEVDALLANIDGQPKESCPYEVKTEGNNGYNFFRGNYIGRHVISITKENFYWTIQVKNDGNFWKKGNDVNITDYVHVETNPDSTLDDLKQALQNTLQFIPEVNMPDYIKRADSEEDPQQNYAELWGLFEKFLKKDINGVGDSDEIWQRHYVQFKEFSFRENNKNIGEAEADILISSLKNIYPALTIHKIEGKYGTGFELVKKEIPALLTAAYKLKIEDRAAKKCNTAPSSSFWKDPNNTLTVLSEKQPSTELSEPTQTASKFTL